jgi:hypothetical protein
MSEESLVTLAELRLPLILLDNSSRLRILAPEVFTGFGLDDAMDLL